MKIHPVLKQWAQYVLEELFPSKIPANQNFPVSALCAYCNPASPLTQDYLCPGHRAQDYADLGAIVEDLLKPAKDDDPEDKEESVDGDNLSGTVPPL